MRIAVDVMGADHGPPAAVRGAVAALAGGPAALRLLLVGQPAAIEAALAACPDVDRGRIEIVPATQVIEMHESPLTALKGKKDSSIARLVQLAAEGRADAIISAGNTGAFIGACQLGLKTIPGVPRVGIATLFPTVHGMVVLCDSGANLEPKPHHLHAYALLSSAFAEVVLKRAQPRVGLMNVGHEDDKGTALCKAARELLAGEAAIRFVGNIEGRDIYSGVCDVIVTDGFTGNVVLKAIEAHIFNLMTVIRGWLGRASADVQSAFAPLAEHLVRENDYQEYGGAHVLGLSAVCMKCHGSSDVKAFKNAVLGAAQAVGDGLCAVLTQRLTGLAGGTQG